MGLDVHVWSCVHMCGLGTEPLLPVYAAVKLPNWTKFYEKGIFDLGHLLILTWEETWYDLF